MASSYFPSDSSDARPYTLVVDQLIFLSPVRKAAKGDVIDLDPPQAANLVATGYVAPFVGSLEGFTVVRAA